MTDENSIPPESSRHALSAAAVGAGFLESAPAAGRVGEEPWSRFPGTEEGEGGGIDLRRYGFALLRYKWLLVVALLLGSGGAMVAWRMGEVQYTAEGNLWISIDAGGSGDVAPIRQSGLLEEAAWVQLLRSYSVVDSVVIQQRLYLSVPHEYRSTFQSFRLAPEFRPGDYRLTVSQDGTAYSLSTQDGLFVEGGATGAAIGAELGFDWTPARNALAPGSELEFSVIPPRDASQDLLERMATGIDRDGNFIRVALRGSDPEEIASIVNALMERHVGLAAELKRGKLEEVSRILEEQLQYAQTEMEQAERDLESFRVTTITLPSDNAPIAPGLQATTAPVMADFFAMRVALEQLRRDRGRLQSVSDSLDNGVVRIETLEAIPAAAQSSELRVALGEIVQARSQLRVLRDRYSDEYPPIQDLLATIRTLETQTVPRVVSGILNELGIQEADLRARVDSASSELAAIPPRTIEEARLRRTVSIQESIYNQLRQRVETARLAAASSIPDVTILDRASAPRRPTQDDRIRYAGLVLAGFLGAGIALALLLDFVDKRLMYPGEVSREIGLPVLGNIPRITRKVGKAGEENASQLIEAFRELRITLGFAYGSAGPMTLVVTSPSQSEGKTLITTNLAVAFAEMGRRTLLIDADTRRGDAHRLLGLERTPGLTDYLRDRSSGEVIQFTKYDHLHFIGSGTRSSTTPELLASQRMGQFFGTLKRAYDVILIDSPPLAAGGDAVLLSALAGNMAIVIRSGSTEKPLTLAKLEGLSRLPIRVLGAILNDVSASGSSYGYYSSSYLPGYEASDEPDIETAAGQPRLLADAGVDEAGGQAS